MASRGWNDVTEQDARAMGRRQAIPEAGKPKAGRSKYGAVKTVVDGVTFASKREAARYVELKQLEKAGHILRLKLQPRFPLMVNGTVIDPGVKIGDYLADFSYYVEHESGGPAGTETELVVEDVKGMKTPVYRLKKKLFEALYRIQIREIR